MAVTQYFTIDVPVEAELIDNGASPGIRITLSRDQAEEIHRELREALGYSGWANATVPPAPDGLGSRLEDFDDDTGPPVGQMMSVEQAAAAMQALAAVPPDTGYRRNAGSGIGNG